MVAAARIAANEIVRARLGPLRSLQLFFRGVRHYDLSILRTVVFRLRPMSIGVLQRFPSPLSAFRRVGFCCLALSLWLPCHAAIPSFPGAEGFGAYATGGRGGDVYFVTNLNSSGSGSLADAIATAPASGRTIVFAVSGYIHVPSSNLRITNSKITIAGQTAPGDGVGLKDGTFRISGDDIVVRHMRFRHGKYGSGGDCIDLDSGSIRCVLDHVSLQFSTDENISSYNSPPENLTMQWSLNAWGLESHSCGGLWDQNHATCHHTLWAHNHTRNPKARPSGLLEWVNNVTFDWDIGFILGDSETPAAWKANVRNSYFLCPPGNLRLRALEKASLDRNGNPNFSLYLDNCRHDADGNGLLDGTDKGYAIASGSYTALAAPVEASGAVPVTLDDPVVAFQKVVSNAGALRLDVAYPGALRDEVDTRLIQNLVTQTANHITGESSLGLANGGFGELAGTLPPLDTDKDGMPDAYEIALGWNPAAQDHNTALASSGGLVAGTTFFPPATPAGYTRLEEYLHFLAIPHGTVARNVAGLPTSITVDLRKFTSGFPLSPTFTVANVVGGTVAQGGPGNALATFTPTLDLTGRARFDFTVTDGAGRAWSQTCALVVTSNALPRDLRWKGSGSTWDTAAPNWVRPATGTTEVFAGGDRVVFDQTGIARPSVTVVGTVAPGSIDVDATGNYSLAGSGTVGCTGALTKRGAGTFTLGNSGANSFRSIALEAGTLALPNATGGGAAKISFNGGALALAPPSNTTIPNALEFNQPATITVGSQHTCSGNWTGSQTVTVNATGGQLWTVAGSWAGFSGRLQAGTGNPRFRLNGSTNVNFGSPSVAVDLGSGTAQLMNRNGATIEIGALASAGAGTVLSGAQSSNTASTYHVGGLNASTTFAGAIVDGSYNNLPAVTHIVKTGTGELLLTGTSTYTGSTTVGQGVLNVAGTLGGTAVAVASGAMLAGSGTLGGSLAATAGAILSPGTPPFTGATLTVGGGLALNNNTLYFDMSSSPAGANDKIVMNGGTLGLTGTIHFQFLLLEDTLGPGTYELVAGATTSTASGVSLTHNLPTASRQTFALSRPPAGSNPSYIRLTVTGNPATLTWTGATSAVWDTASANWSGATPGVFYPNDAVVFDDTSAVNAITVAGEVQPRSTRFNHNTRSYTLGGGVGGTGRMTKDGSGTLTLTGPNNFTGGFVLNAGTVVLANDEATAGALGTGTITLNGGTLNQYRDRSSYTNATWNLAVPAGRSAILNADDRINLYGTVAGGGTLVFRIPYVRTTLFNDWSGFTGTLDVVDSGSGGTGGGDLRMGSNYSFPGFPNGTVNLGANCAAYYSGILSAGAGTTVAIGALSGEASSCLLGGPTGGRALTYRIGGLGTAATFSGTIADQNAASPTAIVKTGAGTWTLAGTCTHSGSTVIEQGTMALSGTIDNTSPLQVAAGAVLDLRGGTASVEGVVVPAGATLMGWGGIVGEVAVAGTCAGRGAGGGAGGVLAVTGLFSAGSTGLVRLKAGADRIAVAGDLELAGTIDLVFDAPNPWGRFLLLTYSGALSLGDTTLSGVPSGMAGVLDTSMPGEVAVVVRHGVPFLDWQMAWFGSTTAPEAQAAADPDGDGQANDWEFQAGTDPKDGSSRFAATIERTTGGFLLAWPSVPGATYAVEGATDPAGPWAPLATVPAAASPSQSTSHLDPGGPAVRFYRVRIEPGG